MGIIDRFDSRNSSAATLETVAKLKEGEMKNSVAALIGLSRGNSYFIEKNIRTLTNAVHEDFSSLSYMLPDKPSVHTLQALGLPEQGAVTTARLDFNRYGNMIRRLFPDILGNNSGMRLLRWETVESELSYQTALDSLTMLYRSNEQFQSDVRQESERMLSKNRNGSYDALSVDEKNRRLNHAVQFLLMEFACILSAPDILGKDTVLYVYHRPMAVMKNLLEGKYDGKKHQNVGSFVYREFAEK